MHTDIPSDIVNNPLNARARKNARGDRKSVLETRHYPKLASGGIKGFNAVVWVESQFKPNRALARGLEIVDSLKEDLKNSRHFKLATRPSEFRRLFESEDAIALILGTEGAEIIEDKLGLLRIFHELGVRIFGFVWNERNLLADGYGELGRRSGGSGLSELGIKVVEECNKLGMIVDAAHITPNGLSDMLEYSKDPIIVSHGSTAVHPCTLRPLSDGHLRQIAENGGVAGMFAINLKNSIPTLKSYIDHIIHAVKVAGADHVGLGFDFVDYLSPESLPTREIPTVHGLENHRLCQRVIESLRAKGLKNFEIEKIASENFLRVFQQVSG